MARRLTANDLRAVCDPDALPFRSTEELPALDGMIGQERAAAATSFGVAMHHTGYNLFALGPSRTGKTTAMRRVLAAAAAAEPVPADHCYVHNFADPYRPRALALPAGRGRALATEMARLVDECQARLPRAFESEAFERQRSELLERFATRQREEIERLSASVRTEGFALVRTPAGVAVAPAPKGEPIGPDEFAALPAETRARYESAGREVEPRVQATLRQLRQIDRELHHAHEQLVRDVAAAAVHQLVEELREHFTGLDAVDTYLGQVEEDLIAHAEEFRTLGESKTPPLPLPFPASPSAFLDRYRVNVLVDRAGATGAPVVVEANPTYGNLLGRLEHRVHFGTLVTDFTQIRAGALHRANGGYLLLEAKDVLRNLFAWEALKKALKGSAIRIEEPLEELRVVTATGLAPEPIPLAVKVVLIGTPLLYYLLHALDEDFHELFKVKVDFDDSLPRTPEFELLVARFVGSACREEGLRPFAADGIAKLIEHGSRLVAHRARLTSRLGDLLDLVREAAFWAERHEHALVAAEDVTRAIAEKIHRENLLEERLGRLIGEGALLIATEGTAVGQVNGISVVALGDHAFGRPTRITARSFSGKPNVVDIERETKLGGPVHSKGVLILSGFIAGRYATGRPLALSASLAFEQTYEEVEGDSASSAELYALLSSIAGVPLRRALAVTGSVNQHGEIQAVGGINEKIEGFFDVCRARGLSPDHGVVIPEANVRNLMLREDVVEAVRAGTFQVYAVATVDEGLALLSGRDAGERGADDTFPAGSVNAMVERVLVERAERLKDAG